MPVDALDCDIAEQILVKVAVARESIDGLVEALGRQLCRCLNEYQMLTRVMRCQADT